MIKQLSGLSVNYYLDKELNKYTDKISEPTNQGEYIAKSTKKFTTPKILKSKDSVRDRDEKKQIRRAGRKAARNTDVDFVKATPMGSDYFSLMAATAENLASRGASKRKAKKAAKKEHQELQKKGSSSFDGKGLKEGFKGADLPKIESGIKTGDFFQSTFNTFKPERIKSIKKQASEKQTSEKPKEDKLAPQNVFDKQVRPMYNKQYGPLAPKNTNSDINQAFGRKIYDVTQKMGEDAKYVLTPEASKEMSKKQIAYNILGMPGEAKKVGQQFKKDRAFAEKNLRTGTNVPFSIPKVDANKFDANLKQEQEKIKSQKESDTKAREEEAKKTLGIQMTGDGFNKGMLRKNKYKK
jgi:hypothetical protein